jgi:hypothetical protein
MSFSSTQLGDRRPTYGEENGLKRTWSMAVILGWSLMTFGVCGVVISRL